MEQLVLLAIFLLVGLVNAILRWRKQGRRAPAPAPEPEPEPLPPWPREAPPRPRELPPNVRVRLPAPPEAAPPAVPRPSVPVRRPRPEPRAVRRPPVHRWLGNRTAVRRAIVAMTLLGPCRALEREPGVRTPGPAGP